MFYATEFFTAFTEKYSIKDRPWYALLRGVGGSCSYYSTLSIFVFTDFASLETLPSDTFISNEI